jgi:hypothetical protein
MTLKMATFIILLVGFDEGKRLGILQYYIFVTHYTPLKAIL